MILSGFLASLALCTVCTLVPTGTGIGMAMPTMPINDEWTMPMRNGTPRFHCTRERTHGKHTVNRHDDGMVYGRMTNGVRSHIAPHGDVRTQYTLERRNMGREHAFGRGIDDHETREALHTSRRPPGSDGSFHKNGTRRQQVARVQ